MRINIRSHICGNFDRIKNNFDTSGFEKRNIRYRPCLRMCSALDILKLCSENSMKSLLKTEVLQTDLDEVFIDIGEVQAHLIK